MNFVTDSVVLSKSLATQSHSPGALYNVQSLTYKLD